MARIPDDELARLKSEVSLQRLVEAEGIALKPHGTDQIGCCPFHEDKTPSLVITPKTNLYHCFGCGAAGSVIDWVMNCRRMSFRQAVDLLRSDLPSASAVKERHHSLAAKTSPSVLDPLISDPALLKRVVAFYHQTLKESPEALAYLKSRGLDHPELIDYFKLGFANRTLGYRLPDKQRKAGREIRSRLEAIGIYRASGHEHFNGSLVIPVMDGQSEVTEIYGRKVGKHLRKGTPVHLYLSGPHRGVFNLQSFAASKEIILCESLIDALTFWCAVYRNVTCAYGIEGFTDELMQALRDHNIERVLIAYDRDDAGNRAAEKLAKHLMGEGMACFRVLFPKGMDANEYACQVKPATKSLGLVIRKAQWLGNGKAPVIETAANPIVSAAKVKRPISSLVASGIVPHATPAHPCAMVASEPDPEVIEESNLPASPLPEPAKTIEAEVDDHEIHMTLGDQEYRIRGLAKNPSQAQLKVNVLVSCGDLMHLDTLDLYTARARQAWIKQASVELGVPAEVIKKDLGKVLLKLEALQDEQIQEKQNPAKAPHPLSQSEQQQALALLQSPDLLGRILDDFKTAGVVGEETNKLVGYLACVSRKLDQPLAIIVQSSSAAGKSSLMDAILNLMPEEERVQYSAMTGQSLFYMGETDLKHKILAIAEQAGAEQAGYALKLLQSEGELTIASTGKDEATGNLVTKEYRVEGPVMLFLTTTAIDIDEELMNRCLVLTVNESREQTRAIHAMQRKQQTLAGLMQDEDKKRIVALHRNAQRLLRPLLVANPYAEQLTFIDDKTRTRRDHMKYLTLIRAIALLHQYQREVKTVDHHGEVLRYIEVTQSDIGTANQLANEVLGRSLDELPPQTRLLLQQIHQMVSQHCQSQSMDQADYRFSRRDVRGFTGWSDFQIKKHISRLQDFEYLLVHRGSRGHSFVYELLYQGEGEGGQPFLLGLLSMEKAGSATANGIALPPASLQSYDKNKEPLNQNIEPPSRPQVAAKEPPSSPSENARQAFDNGACGAIEEETAENAVIRNKSNGKSSRTHASAPPA